MGARMLLTKFRVKGYQSFSDSGELNFGEGINLIVGQNNSGKSALLRAIRPQLDDDRHRTPDQWEQYLLPLPEVFAQFEVAGSELSDAILRVGSAHIPMPPGTVQARPYLEGFFAHAGISIDVKLVAGQALAAKGYPSHGLFALTPNSQPVAGHARGNNGQLDLNDALITADSDQLPNLVHDIWHRDVFYFQAERFGLGEFSPDTAVELFPDARNLPIVLNMLQSDRADAFDKLVEHLTTIFPTVGHLSVSISPSTKHLEILVWPTRSRNQRDLSFPLLKSGTGVAQVIALLAAIMLKKQAIFVIDEINSFLHPAAVKALLRILQTDYAHHQYIISTHAPEVIGFSNPSTIHLVARDGYESHVTQLDVASVRAFRAISDNLGLSMADVFAADEVVWVEGPTEELCFPYLHEQRIGPLPRGLVFSSVVATGDFNRNRNRKLVYEVYQKISTVTRAMQVRVVFSFDKEKLKDAEIEQMVREAKGRLFFLPRRQLECYLLDETAIAEFIVERDPQSAGRVTPETVEQSIGTIAADPKFKITGWKNDIRSDAWLANVDAAKLIDAVCQAQSNLRATFNKKEDSLLLLKSILKREPARLRSLAEYVKTLVDAVVKIA